MTQVVNNSALSTLAGVFDIFDVFDVFDVPQVVNDSALSTLAGVLLALELRGAHTYYQVSSSDEVYPPQYQANKCVGILWTHLAQRQTWFGAAVYLVHGIQQLPATPVNEALLPAAWIAEELPGSCE